MHGGHIAAHVAAAEKKKKLAQEEEEMTQYRRDELEHDWEFKIVRSSTNQFKKPEVVERIKAEEAMAGWVMVEKFDNGRIRFKRPLSAQRRDASLPPGVDPYRIDIGISQGGLEGMIVGATVVASGLVLLLIYLFVGF